MKNLHFQHLVLQSLIIFSKLTWKLISIRIYKNKVKTHSITNIFTRIRSLIKYKTIIANKCNICFLDIGKIIPEHIQKNIIVLLN